MKPLSLSGRRRGAWAGLILAAIAVPSAAHAGPSDVGVAITDKLTRDFASSRNTVWNTTIDNRVDAGWLLQTPPRGHWDVPYAQLDMPGHCTAKEAKLAPDQCDPDYLLRICDPRATNPCAVGRCAQLHGAAHPMCVGHSDQAILDPIYDLVTSAHSVVDVTSLARAPDRRFLATLRNAIGYLSAQQRSVDVRFLFGTYAPVGAVNNVDELARLSAKASGKVRVYVGGLRKDWTGGWNHAKIIAVDGQTAIVGGHNLWTRDYLDEFPIHDLSMQVSGTAARDAQLFAQRLWSWMCAKRVFPAMRAGNGKPRKAIGDACPKQLVIPPATAGAGKVVVIAAGRLASLADNSENAADAALQTMLEASAGPIRISQQDIFFNAFLADRASVETKPTKVLGALARALVLGRDVYIVVSGPKPKFGRDGATDYNNGQDALRAPWTAQHVAAELRKRTTRLLGDATEERQLRALCHLHVAPIGARGAQAAYPKGFDPGNHAKTVLVGDRHGPTTFYIGSQNLYPAPLIEYGYFVDDRTLAGQYLADYWDPLWRESRAKQVRGDKRCGDDETTGPTTTADRGGATASSTATTDMDGAGDDVGYDEIDGNDRNSSTSNSWSNSARRTGRSATDRDNSSSNTRSNSSMRDDAYGEGDADDEGDAYGDGEYRDYDQYGEGAYDEDDTGEVDRNEDGNDQGNSSSTARSHSSRRDDDRDPDYDPYGEDRYQDHDQGVEDESPGQDDDE